MADITKCTSTICNAYETCYRKTALDSENQSWADFTASYPYGENGWVVWDEIKRAYVCRFFIHKDKVAV